jgi:hypothetical protein
MGCGPSSEEAAVATASLALQQAEIARLRPVSPSATAATIVPRIDSAPSSDQCAPQDDVRSCLLTLSSTWTSRPDSWTLSLPLASWEGVVLEREHSDDDDDDDAVQVVKHITSAPSAGSSLNLHMLVVGASSSGVRSLRDTLPHLRTLCLEFADDDARRPPAPFTSLQFPPRLRTLVLVRAGLTGTFSLPAGSSLAAWCESVTLRHNNIDSIDWASLAAAQRLRQLDLSHNGIRGAFEPEKCPATLTTLCLAHNQLRGRADITMMPGEIREFDLRGNAAELHLEADARWAASWVEHVDGGQPCYDGVLIEDAHSGRRVSVSEFAALAKAQNAA